MHMPHVEQEGKTDAVFYFKKCINTQFLWKYYMYAEGKEKRVETANKTL